MSTAGMYAAILVLTHWSCIPSDEVQCCTDAVMTKSTTGSSVVNTDASSYGGPPGWPDSVIGVVDLA